MNKKFYGTLLLGTLLLGSTIVSCKDYDDDIDNLQSQVDALKSSAALKTDVDGLKSSLEGAISSAQNAATAAKAAADAAEKKASDATSELAKKAAQADLEAAQAKLAAAEEKLAKLEAAIAELDGLEAKLTEATAAEFDKMKKELNAEFDAIKESVSAMIQSLEIIDLKISKTKIINNGELLHWGVAATDIEWAGPKGNISQGDLLVGFIQSTEALTVVPATVDLSEANIELVNSLGEAAPVSITATPASKSNAGVIVGSTRAADIQGKWNLDVAPAGVDATTIADAYAVNQGTGKPNNNVRYAVSVDGRVVTGYDYEVDVEKAACKDKYTAKDVIDNKKLEYVDSKKSSLVAGVDNEYKVQTSKIYDAYLTFEGNDAERAEELGIQANGLTISIPEDVTSRNDIYATLYAIDLTGTITKQRTKLSAQSGVDPDEGDVVATATTVKPGLKNSDVKIAIGTIIKGLSDSDAKQIKSIKVDNMAETPFVYALNTVKGYNSYDEEVATSGTTFDVRTIRTLEIPATATVNAQAVEGADTLKVDFMGNSSDIIKTIYVPVNVVKPTAAELAAEIKVASAWNGDKLKLTYDNTKILSTQIFANNAALKEFSVGGATVEYTLVANKTALTIVHVGGYAGAVDTLGINNTNAVSGMYAAISTSNPTKEWKIKTGTATFKLAEVAAWTFTYNFDIEMVDAYAGYSLKWMKINADNTISAVAKGEMLSTTGQIMGSDVTTVAGIGWQHAVNGTDVNEAYSAAISPMTNIATIEVTMNDPANTIDASAGSTKTGTKWTSNGTDPYTFGAISTAETEATVDFAYTNDFGVTRTYTMTFEFK